MAMVDRSVLPIPLKWEGLSQSQANLLLDFVREVVILPDTPVVSVEKQDRCDFRSCPGVNCTSFDNVEEVLAEEERVAGIRGSSKVTRLAQVNEETYLLSMFHRFQGTAEVYHVTRAGLL
ncbi:hypothetical protein Pmar_PMAR002131, partial [Perkinsus marinus ATCC 50983]